MLNNNFFRRHTSCRWELAFLKESLEDILNGQRPHFIYINNPFYKEFWFADPFILDIKEHYIYVLAETMPRSSETKAFISLLTIDRHNKSIAKMENILQEEWHLSFPCIIRKGEDIYVCPESAEAERLFLYKLVKDSVGNHHLKRIKSICDDTVWDSDITRIFGSPLMFTAKQDNYHLDIYSWDSSIEKFIFSQSISSSRQNMRLAGSLFKLKGCIYCPQQDSGYTYGNAVEINKIKEIDGHFYLSQSIVIRPPRRLMIDGLHTFNSYNGLIVVDLLRQEHLLGLILRKLVSIKKRLGF